MPEPERAERERMHALFTVPLAGQTVSVLPLTLLVADPPSRTGPLDGDREAMLLWADSTLSEALLTRAPEVNWLLPPELRERAERAPTLVTDPDRMGQAILRNEGMNVLPDPFRTYARNLVAVTDGRLLLVPASLEFTDVETRGTRAQLVMVMADARMARVVWRTVATGYGPTAGLALDSAMATVLPLSSINQ